MNLLTNDKYTGRTVLLRGLCDLIDPNLKISVVESDLELRLVKAMTGSENTYDK